MHFGLDVFKPMTTDQAAGQQTADEEKKKKIQSQIDDDATHFDGKRFVFLENLFTALKILKIFTLGISFVTRSIKLVQLLFLGLLFSTSFRDKSLHFKFLTFTEETSTIFEEFADSMTP